MRSADVVLGCLSPRSVGKEGYVQKEIKFALDVADEKPPDTIFLIPVRLEECTVPERLRPWHWVDFWLPRGYEKLLRALRERAGPIVPAAVETLEPQAGTVMVNPKDGLEYVWIPAGEFLTGAVPGDTDAGADEKPRHPVVISKGFWLGKTPVTVAAYKRFTKATGRNLHQPTRFQPRVGKGTTIRSCMLAGTRPLRIASGPMDGCRPGRNGSMPHAAGRKASYIRGEMRSARSGQTTATGAGVRLRQRSFRRKISGGFTTWRATSGSGGRIGTGTTPKRG